MKRFPEAVVFDFDGVILDSETAEFESHRLIYERCGVPLTPAEWCDQIGIWVEGHEDRWAVRLRGLSDRAPGSSAASRTRLGAPGARGHPTGLAAGVVGLFHVPSR